MVIDAKGVQRERPSESFASIVTDVFGPEVIGIIDESRITLLYDTEIELFDDLFNPSGLYKRRGTPAQIIGVVGEKESTFKTYPTDLCSIALRGRRWGPTSKTVLIHFPKM